MFYSCIQSERVRLHVTLNNEISHYSTLCYAFITNTAQSFELRCFAFLSFFVWLGLRVGFEEFSQWFARRIFRLQIHDLHLLSSRADTGRYTQKWADKIHTGRLTRTVTYVHTDGHTLALEDKYKLTYRQSHEDRNAHTE